MRDASAGVGDGARVSLRRRGGGRIEVVPTVGTPHARIGLVRKPIPPHGSLRSGRNNHEVGTIGDLVDCDVGLTGSEDVHRSARSRRARARLVGAYRVAMHPSRGASQVLIASRYTGPSTPNRREKPIVTSPFVECAPWDSDPEPADSEADGASPSVSLQVADRRSCRGDRPYCPSRARITEISTGDKHPRRVRCSGGASHRPAGRRLL